MGKLMKYDLRAALRLFIPLWIGTLVLGLVNGVTIEMEQSDNRYLNFFTGLFAVLFVLAIFAILIVAAIYVVQRFYQSMLKDEGYLTFTLPVGIDSILWSKALTVLRIDDGGWLPGHAVSGVPVHGCGSAGAEAPHGGVCRRVCGHQYSDFLSGESGTVALRK